MTGIIALFGYACVLMLAGPRLLVRARWTQRLPRLGIAAWQALSYSLVAAVVLGGMELTMPTLCICPDLTQVWSECERALRLRFDTPGGAVFGSLGGLLAGTVLARTAYASATAGVSAARARARQREHLAVLGHYDPSLGATVVEHSAPAAYCLPGRGGRVVITTAALNALDGRQLRAVLAHERAHLHERHELMLASAAALTRALPHVRAMAVAREQIALLVEMVADDVASVHADRLTVADALLTLASSPAPVAALGAAGTTSAVRIRRLIAAEPPGHFHDSCPNRFLAMGLVAMPLLLLVAGAVGATRFNC